MSPKASTMVVADESWMVDGACVGADPDLWFPERGDSTAEAKAKATCAACPVRERCLEYAVVNGVRHGVWGGLSERQRRRLARGLPVSSAKPPKPQAVTSPIRAGSVLPATAVHRRSLTPHGNAIRNLLADGQWRTLDEVAAVVRPTLTAGTPAWQHRHARYLATVTLNNMRRNGLVEHRDGYWRQAR